MKRNTPLETERLIIRHWTLSASDRSFFHEIHSDPKVRKFYPDSLTREQSDERLERLVEQASKTNIIWRVACLKEKRHAAWLYRSFASPPTKQLSHLLWKPVGCMLNRHGAMDTQLRLPTNYYGMVLKTLTFQKLWHSRFTIIMRQ